MTASNGSLRRWGQGAWSNADRSLGAAMKTGPLGAWAPGPRAGYLPGNSTATGRAAAAWTVAGVHGTGLGSALVCALGALARWARAMEINASRLTSRLSLASAGSGVLAVVWLRLAIFQIKRTGSK